MARHRRCRARGGLAALCLSVAAGAAGSSPARAASPVIVQNLAGFEGLEEATVIYFPATNTFQNDPTNYPNIVDEGGGMIRSTLRNYQPTLGWWDGDRATTNTDRQREEVKGIDNLGHQKVGDTFEYSFDLRTNPGFAGTSHFCHLFQLKATDGNSGPPLVTVSLYKNGSGLQGRVINSSDGGANTPRTFGYTAGEWAHFVVRITTCAAGQSTGAILTSVNGDAFTGVSNAPIYLNDSTDYRPKWGLYRGIMTDYGVPEGDSWVEHRTVTGYIGATNLLTWKGGSSANAWDSAGTQNFLNGAAAAAFNTLDQVIFDNSTANTSVNLTANVAPGYTRVNSSQNYTFAGSFGITGGTLRKDGSGTLTLATTNSYPGLTDVRAGTLYVTGSIGNNSLVSLTGGTLKAGSTAALGTNSTIGTQIAGGTLDINGFNLATEPVFVQGTGVGGAGAIVNNEARQTTALAQVTLTGDATFGGAARWDVRGSGAALSTGGKAYNLTKTGANQVALVATAVDAAQGNININQGMLAFQTGTSSMGDPGKAVNVAAGATLGFYNTAAVMNKVCTLNGGRIWAESGTGIQNTFAGPITLGGGGGIVEASSGAVLTLSGNIGGVGGLTKNGAGTVTLAGANNYTGVTTVNAGALVMTRSFTSGAGAIIATGAAAQLATSPTTTSNVVLKVPTLSLTGTGKLDLRDNKLIVTAGSVGSFTGSAYDGITGFIQSGRATGAWDGGGIVTSMSDAAAGSLTSLGVATATQAGRAGGTFGGVSVAGADVLVMYTYGGDANLDGQINIDDYGQIDSNVSESGTVFGWYNGDFNYDGKINIDDYGIIDGNINRQVGTFPTSIAVTPRVAGAPSGTAAVPEPAGPAFVALLAIASGGRRRRLPTS